ncbi:MAG: branched-chain amino acid ABC transporter permease [Gammaproteobacteria bacterium]|nr:branched-chain amino acid ABC transporter permease [Gammaproteobacteria bacterium]
MKPLLNVFSKESIIIIICAALVLFVFSLFGAAFGFRMLAEIACFSIIALGLSIQWGYAGLFNAGIMGFIAIAAFTSMLVSFPVNEDFRQSIYATEIIWVFVKLVMGIVIIWGINRLPFLQTRVALRRLLLLVAIAVTYLIFMQNLEPVASGIEKEAGFIGGFGLPVWMGWIAGGIVAGILAWFVGHICLGLRSDYLAIATLGIAEIIKAVLKNADWLTRGTLTVSPLPWPVSTPGEIGFIASRALYLTITVIMIGFILWLLQRAYNAPWGRMIRAIRDNELSSAAMGKDVNARRLEVFIFGAVLMGVGGAALVTFNSIFDPSGFLPLHHTFLIWVMVILGGAGNNMGTILGTMIVYIVWVMSEPATLLIFEAVKYLGVEWFNWQVPNDFDSRALQMRVFLIGMTITLVLRYAPQGLLPEKIREN